MNTMSDFREITAVISELDIDPLEKYDLISKLIVWENSKGDF